MALQDDVRILASLPVFADLEPDAVRIIAFSAETRILRTGDVLFRADQPSDGGYVVLTGALSLRSDGGRETRVRAPALLGEAALVAATVYPATAVAVDPSSVLKVSRALYRRILGEFPESARRARAGAALRLFSMRDELDGLRRSMDPE